MKKVFGVALYVVLLAVSGYAQFDSSVVLGVVRDSTGAVLVQTNVGLMDAGTGILNRTVTDDTGSFVFLNVKAGTYSIRADRPGFRTFSSQNIVVAVGARQRVDVTMQVGAVTETVEVVDAAQVLETDRSDHGQVINAQQINEIPLNGRAYSDLALLSTNVHRSPLATSGTPREGAFNVNGMRSTYNNFLLDGVDNNAYGTSNQGFANQVAQPSPGAISEFKVITNNYSAEYGRAGGAVVNASMKSGSNSIHGSAFEFLRNTNLNAVGYVFGVRPSTFKKPTLQRNQFGMTLGGPVVRNKAFFFGDYEGFRELAKTLQFASLPSLTDRTAVLPVAVWNPLTGVLYPANTPIPTSATSSFARKVLEDLPAPTGAGRSNNFQQLTLDRNYNDKFDGRLDGQLNDRLSGFLRFSQRKVNIFNQPQIPGASGGNSNGFTRVLNQAWALSATWVTSSSSLLEFRLGVSRTNAGKQPPLLGGPSMEALYGITGLPTTPELTGGLTNQSITGFTALGRQATNPQFQNPLVWNPKLNYSWIAGRHALKAGYEFQMIRTQVQDINPLYGRDTYNSSFSRPTCAVLGQPSTCTVPADTASYGVADFLFGLRNQYALASYKIGNYRQHQHFTYLQDDVRLTSKLTVNLGLRYEYATPRWERDNVLSNFDPSTNTLVPAQAGSLSKRALVDPDRKNFGPRVGLAYSAASDTVVRASYGISYVHNNRVGSADLLGINGPQVVIATVDQTPLVNGAPNPAFRTTQQGYPAGLTSSTNFDPVRANIAYVPRNLRWPMVQTWMLSVQREVMKDTVVELAYTGNRSSRLPIVADYNQALPNQPGQNLGIQARRPIQSFGAITWFNPAGASRYHGLSWRVERRQSKGLYLLNSFTWSKGTGNSEQQLETHPGVVVANPQNVRNLDAEWGPSSYDIKLMNVTSAVYSLPFGRNQRFGSSWTGPLNTLLGGWQLSGVNTANTGEPVNVVFNPASDVDPTGRISDFRGANSMRPNLIADPTGSTGAARVDNYFNKAAFQIPTASAPYGNLGRNAFRAPSFWQLDLALQKSVDLPREDMKVQFRSEFFNILNRTNFRPPEPNFSSAAFGTIRSTYSPRQIQFALKVLW